MEALICRKHGDPTIPPDSFDDSSPFVVAKSHPIPDLTSPTSVRVRVKAASLNYNDYLLSLGTYQEKRPFPFIPGSDYSGVIDSVGSDVTMFKIGDRVSSSAPGSFAQFVVDEEHRLSQVPDECDLVAAAALPTAFGTSHAVLFHKAQLRPGQVLLILGAAGGVGLSAVQIAKLCGAVVITVARGAEKMKILESMGVDHVVDSNKGSIIESVKGFLKSRNLKGVDLLYDPVGGKLTKESLKLLNWGAHIFIIGFVSNEVPVIPANLALVKNWTIHGFYWGNYEALHPGIIVRTVNELLSLMAKGLINVHVSHAYRLSEANLAFSAIKDRTSIGKVMIVFDDHESVRSKL